MKKFNRFAVLRRKNRNILCKADTTTEELAEKLGISTGTISRLENECMNDDVPNTTAAGLKAYHDKHHCSYEYLMGETRQETNKYANASTTMPFKMLTTQDIDNLANIFSDPQYGSMYASFFSAMLSKPEELKELIYKLVRSFKDIADNNSAYTKKTSEYLNRPVRYTYTTLFAENIEEHFIPCMGKVISQYTDILADEAKRTAEDLVTADLDNPVATTGEYEEFMRQTTTINGADITVKVTKVEQEDSQ